MSDQDLSVVMPCYNEARTITLSLERVLALPFVLEVIVVDDGSTDLSADLVRRHPDRRVRLIQQPYNRGKGAAVRRGFSEARAPFVVVQDADLEYDPQDLTRLLYPLREGRADVVYGSRFRGGAEHRVLYFWHSMGNRFLTLLSNMATDLNLTDMETCYKVFRTDIIQHIHLEEDRFGFEPEVTAKIAAMGCRVFEVGISYSGRTYEEGKKIGAKDGFRAVLSIAKYSPLLTRRARRLKNIGGAPRAYGPKDAGVSSAPGRQAS